MLVIILRTFRFHWKGAHIVMATYDSKDLWIDAYTSNKQQHSLLFQGLSQYARLQLDRHSEELVLLRVSDPVISTLESIFCFIKRIFLRFISHGHHPLQIILH